MPKSDGIETWRSDGVWHSVDWEEAVRAVHSKHAIDTHRDDGFGAAVAFLIDNLVDLKKSLLKMRGAALIDGAPDYTPGGLLISFGARGVKTEVQPVLQGMCMYIIF